MDIIFFYRNQEKSYKHEVIITSFANAISKIIELPESLEVCLYPLEHNVYGGIDKFKLNRLGINYNVSLEALPKVLTHELIHINQKHTGKLKITQNGMCYWYGIPYTKKLPEEMSYEEYQNLPWELDVVNRQQKIFREALALVSNH